MEKLTLWYGITSLLLGVALIFPIRKFITAVSVNKLRKKEKRAATKEEIMRIRKRAGLYAAIISITFAFLYNKLVMFKYLENLVK